MNGTDLKICEDPPYHLEVDAKEVDYTPNKLRVLILRVATVIVVSLEETKSILDFKQCTKCVKNLPIINKKTINKDQLKVSPVNEQLQQSLETLREFHNEEKIQNCAITYSSQQQYSTATLEKDDTILKSKEDISKKD
ncbi:hypothetical protein ABEB36_010909 [Hypothenemus hampei]|uniref:Uncharacterized protein n=1 Tax=Hypothenemus hampei TaxID=57062 RepID=A0ABD1EFG8_HYPHA